MGAATGSGADSTNNICGIANGHAYTLIAAFEITDSYNTKNPVYMIRNPWG